MNQTIIFPIDWKTDNRQAYNQVIQFAQKNAAEKIILFSCLSNEEIQDIDKVYFHLLELNGYFQSTVNQWKPIDMKIDSKVAIGNKKTSLKALIVEENPHWVVAPKEASYRGLTAAAKTALPSVSTINL